MRLVLVVGSPNSSNSNRLREVAQNMGVERGCFAPEVLVEEVVSALREQGVAEVELLEGVEERVTFPLPKGLANL